MKTILYKKHLFLFIGMIFLQSCFLFKKSTKHITTSKTERQKQEVYTQRLGVKVNDDSNLKLMQACVSWLGVPYKFGGTTKQGVDCSGLVSSLYKEGYNKQIPRTTKEMFDKSKRVSEKDLKEGDLVFFNFDSKKVSHVGLYLNENKFIHASTKKGVIIGSLDDPYNKKYFIRGARVE